MESFKDFGLRPVYTVIIKTRKSARTKGHGHYLTLDPELLNVDIFKHILKIHWVN